LTSLQYSKSWTFGDDGRFVFLSFSRCCCCCCCCCCLRVSIRSHQVVGGVKVSVKAQAEQEVSLHRSILNRGLLVMMMEGLHYYLSLEFCCCLCLCLCYKRHASIMDFWRCPLQPTRQSLHHPPPINHLSSLVTSVLKDLRSVHHTWVTLLLDYLTQAWLSSWSRSAKMGAYDSNRGRTVVCMSSSACRACS
jgi:hypothetical protein